MASSLRKPFAHPISLPTGLLLLTGEGKETALETRVEMVNIWKSCLDGKTCSADVPEPATASGGKGKGGGNILANKAKGDAYRDEVAGSLTAAGRDVTKEVPKKTPFGRRVIDVEVKHNGKTLGGVETKTGKSPYGARQRAKDNYLKQQGYPVNVVRQPKE